MSEHRNSSGIAAPLVVLADELRAHQALPPDKKNANRAKFGAFLCGTCSYVALAPDVPSFPDGEWKLGFAAVFAWGVLLLVIGWRGSRGVRDVLGAIFAIAIPAIGFIATANYWPDLLQDTYVRAFCTGIIVANGVQFAICIRGPGGGTAEKQVREQIAQHEFNWKPAKRH
jgi:hypothetical protein